MDTNPSVSCFCLTYGRPRILEDAIYSFIQQDYAGFFKVDTAWFWNHHVLSGPVRNLFHAASCWSRDLFDAVRGYPAEGSGCDRIFEMRLAAGFPGSIEPWVVTPEGIRRADYLGAVSASARAASAFRPVAVRRRTQAARVWSQRS